MTASTIQQMISGMKTHSNKEAQEVAISARMLGLWETLKAGERVYKPDDMWSKEYTEERSELLSALALEMSGGLDLTRMKIKNSLRDLYYRSSMEWRDALPFFEYFLRKDEGELSELRCDLARGIDTGGDCIEINRMIDQRNIIRLVNELREENQ